MDKKSLVLRLILIIAMLTHFTSCSGFFYYPDKVLYSLPEKLNPPIKYDNNIRFKATDGTTLHAWRLYRQDMTKPSKGLVVLFHGNAQNLSAHYIGLHWLTAHGYDLFIFDYRGYGLSEGSPNPGGIQLDAIAALNYAAKLYKAEKPQRFIIYGQSLGGIIATNAFPAFNQREIVDLLILEGTFSSYKEIVQEKMSDMWFTWPFQYLGRLLVSDKFAAHHIIPQIERPVLVIHGQQDPIVPYRFGVEIYDRLTTPRKWMWSEPNGSHIDLYFNQHTHYRDKLLQFLSRL